MISFAPIAPARKRAVTAVQKEAGVLTRLADAMREMAFAGQTIDADSLALRGFTSQEIERHGRDARDLATSLSIRRVA